MVIDEVDGVMVSVAVPVASAETLSVPVRSSEPTPVNVGFTTPPPDVAVKLNPLLPVSAKLAPVPPLKLTLRSVILKPVGAVIVKLREFDVFAKAAKSSDTLKPPPLVGVSVSAPESELVKLLKTLPLMLHPVPVRLPKVVQGVAQLAVAITKHAAARTNSFRIHSLLSIHGAGGIETAHDGPIRGRHKPYKRLYCILST